MAELETQETSETPGPGAIICYAREQLGITSEDLAAELKLSKHKLKLIEQNEFAQVGTPTFIRGYLRNAARVLQLDVDMLLSEYEAFAGDSETPELEKDASDKLQEKSASIKPAWFLVLLAVLAVGIWWLLLGEKGSEDAVQAQPSVSEPATEKPHETPPLVTLSEPSEVGPETEQENSVVLSADSRPEEAQDTESQVEVEEANESGADLQENAAQALPEESAEQIQAAEAGVESSDELEIAEGEKVLLFRFNDSCWLQVRDATGKRLYSNTKDAGQQLRLQGAAPFRVNFGNVRAVELEIDGKPYPIEARSGRKTLAITIP